jgi:hypothetical protein
MSENQNVLRDMRDEQENATTPDELLTPTPGTAPKLVTDRKGRDSLGDS